MNYSYIALSCPNRGDWGKYAKMLHGAGLASFHSCYSNLEEQIKSVNYNHPWLLVNKKGELDAYGSKDVTNLSGKVGEFKSIGELINFLLEKRNKPIRVVLNEDYTAIVSEDSIEVGCQTFPISILDKLVEARKQLEK